MKRYFYTDRDAASWNERMHGIKVEWSLNDDDYCPTCNSRMAADKRLYIHPDSLNLLEPRKGDLCELKGDPEHDHYELIWELITAEYPAPATVEFDTDNSSFYRGKLQERLARIIQRNLMLPDFNRMAEEVTSELDAHAG